MLICVCMSCVFWCHVIVLLWHHSGVTSRVAYLNPHGPGDVWCELMAMWTWCSAMVTGGDRTEKRAEGEMEGKTNWGYTWIDQWFNILICDLYLYISLFICIYIYIYVWYFYTYIYIWYSYIYLFMYVYIYIYVYMCVYVFIANIEKERKRERERESYVMIWYGWILFHVPIPPGRMRNTPSRSGFSSNWTYEACMCSSEVRLFYPLVNQHSYGDRHLSQVDQLVGI